MTIAKIQTQAMSVAVHACLLLQHCRSKEKRNVKATRASLNNRIMRKAIPSLLSLPNMNMLLACYGLICDVIKCNGKHAN